MVKPSKPIDVYVRMSRVAGRQNLISPDEQERRARDLAREHGLKVGIVIQDIDESGGKLDRPGLQEALRRVESGKSGGLIVAWLDRLSRDSEHALSLVRRISEAGGAIYAPDAPSDWTTPEGELQAGIVFIFAQYVRQRARAGFERAKERSIEAGVPVISRPPVGYRKRADRRLEPDPQTAPVIRELFERRAAGEGLSSLARFLAGKRVKTSFGSTEWLVPTVAHVLRNRVYLGEISFGRDRRYVNPNAHEPLVDLATWTAAQKPTVRPRRSRGAFLLSGLLRCQACGYAMKGQTNPGGRRVYRCQKRHAGGICPAPGWTRAEPIEEGITRLFLEAQEVVVTGEQDQIDLSEIEEEFARAERRLEQVMSPEVQDAAGDTWIDLMRGRRKERDERAEALGRARAKQGRPALVGKATMTEVWNGLPLYERRELVAEWLDAIVLRRLPQGGYDFVLFGAGQAPELRDRSRRRPALHPIDVPDGARVVTFHDSTERVGDAI